MGQIRTWRAGDAQKQEEIETVKAWFRRLRSMAEAVNIQREKVSRQQEAATRVTQSFSGLPIAAGNGDKILDAVCKMDGENRELARMESDLAKLRIEAISRTFCIVYAENSASLREADVLRAYYIECEAQDERGNFRLKTYQDVANEQGVALSTVCDSLKRGFEALAEIWPDISKNCA